jgi:DDE family transposase
MTLLVLYHASRFNNFKTFDNGVVLVMLRPLFPDAPCYERFLTLTKRVWVLLAFFLAGRSGDKTGIYYIDSTPLPVCHNRRIAKHKVFEGLAERGKTSMGWFFGFKLHLVFNHMREIVAVKLTPGNVSDTAIVPQLTKDLMGKLFGDKGYIGKKLAEELLRRGLVLMTRVRANMKSLPVSFFDKALLNGRSIAETIIGHIKEFSSLRLPKHRSVFNAFTHITAAIIAYQINPLSPQPITVKLP